MSDPSPDAPTPSAPTAPTAPTVPLPVADDDLARCVACGLCLPQCPTWRVTGREIASPRGRIAAMRAVQWEGAPLDTAFATAMDECVQCRACEPVCPAFVPFGRLMEGARTALHAEGRRRTRTPVQRVAEAIGYRAVLPRHWLLLALTWLLWLLQRLRLVPRRAGLPPLRRRSLRRLTPGGGASGAAGERVILFTGCVMDAWMRDTHRSAVELIEAAGGRVELPGRGADCCGALHVHAGRVDEARALARRTMEAMPGDAPILVDSAGCGAALKDYGHLVGSPEAEAFAGRVRDVHEWLAGRDIEGLTPTGRPVVVQDPCHLRNVQRVEGAVRDLLGRAFEVLETDDQGLCCGAGGAYAALQPTLAGAVRDRKVAALTRAGGAEATVASANPGCVMHLASAGVDARHPVDLVAAELRRRKEQSGE